MISEVSKKSFICLFVLLGTACSSSKVRENRIKPVAAAPVEVDETTKKTFQSDKPQALNPETQKSVDGRRYIPLVPASGSKVLEAVALAGAIVGLSQVARTQEPRTDLNGSCVYGEPDSAMVSPCINATVNLLDVHQVIAASASTNQQGYFRFAIPAGEKYYVQVVDRKNRSALTKELVGQSQVVSLFLKP